MLPADMKEASKYAVRTNDLEHVSNSAATCLNYENGDQGRVQFLGPRRPLICTLLTFCDDTKLFPGRQRQCLGCAGFLLLEIISRE